MVFVTVLDSRYVALGAHPRPYTVGSGAMELGLGLTRERV